MQHTHLLPHHHTHFSGIMASVGMAGIGTHSAYLTSWDLLGDNSATSESSVTTFSLLALNTTPDKTPCRGSTFPHPAWLYLPASFSCLYATTPTTTTRPLRTGTGRMEEGTCPSSPPSLPLFPSPSLPFQTSSLIHLPSLPHYHRLPPGSYLTIALLRLTPATHVAFTGPPPLPPRTTRGGFTHLPYTCRVGSVCRTHGSRTMPRHRACFVNAFFLPLPPVLPVVHPHCCRFRRAHTCNAYFDTTPRIPSVLPPLCVTAPSRTSFPLPPPYITPRALVLPPLPTRQRSTIGSARHLHTHGWRTPPRTPPPCARLFPRARPTVSFARATRTPSCAARVTAHTLHCVRNIPALLHIPVWDGSTDAAAHAALPLPCSVL